MPTCKDESSVETDQTIQIFSPNRPDLLRKQPPRTLGGEKVMFAIVGDEEPSAVPEADNSDADFLEMPDDPPNQKKRKDSIENLSPVLEAPICSKKEMTEETDDKELQEPSISDEVLEWPPETLSSWLAKLVVIDDTETEGKHGRKDDQVEDGED